ncbi:MAG: O-acetyl-ADP-ribose deacetylase [Pirellulaceae bacterium]|nr:O-acetyl-ADP-ribose deacetylase [Pirellulaceae bacterium]
MSPNNPLSRMAVEQADITRAAVEAIVNAANQRMLGGGGVDYAIHRAAGPGLLEECRGVAEVRPDVRCPTGEARITGGHRLPARWVIHTVGPVWHGGQQGEPELLRSCYQSSLQLAVRQGIRTIAFPGISCGVFGYPLELAAQVAVRAVADFLAADDMLEQVTFMDIDGEVVAAFRTALEDAGGQRR